MPDGKIGLRPHALHPGTIQEKEGIKFCHLATLREPTYANAVVQRQMRRDELEASHYANSDVKNTSPWMGGGSSR